MSSPRDSGRSIYQAFGRGDIGAVLERLAPDVQWDVFDDHAAQRAGVPWLQPRRGRDEVQRFFALIGGWKVHAFDVVDIVGDGRQVAAELRVDFDVGGRRLRDEELHLWSFGADGRVERFRHYVDTAKHIQVAGLAGAG